MTNRTCSNCEHYCATLSDSDSPFHIHNYCKVWRSEIPADYFADIEEDKDENYDITGKYIGPIIYDDIESSKAVCWCFKEKDN